MSCFIDPPSLYNPPWDVVRDLQNTWIWKWISSPWLNISRLFWLHSQQMQKLMIVAVFPIASTMICHFCSQVSRNRDSYWPLPIYLVSLTLTKVCTIHLGMWCAKYRNGSHHHGLTHITSVLIAFQIPMKCKNWWLLQFTLSHRLNVILTHSYIVLRFRNWITTLWNGIDINERYLMDKYRSS